MANQSIAHLPANRRGAHRRLLSRRISTSSTVPYRQSKGRRPLSGLFHQCQMAKQPSTVRVNFCCTRIFQRVMACKPCNNRRLPSDSSSSPTTPHESYCHVSPANGGHLAGVPSSPSKKVMACKSCENGHSARRRFDIYANWTRGIYARAPKKLKPIWPGEFPPSSTALMAICPLTGALLEIRDKW